MSGPVGLWASLPGKADLDQTLSMTQTLLDEKLFAYAAFTAGAAFFAR